MSIAADVPEIATGARVSVAPDATERVPFTVRIIGIACVPPAMVASPATVTLPSIVAPEVAISSVPPPVTVRPSATVVVAVVTSLSVLPGAMLNVRLPSESAVADASSVVSSVTLITTGVVESIAAGLASQEMALQSLGVSSVPSASVATAGNVTVPEAAVKVKGPVYSLPPIEKDVVCVASAASELARRYVAAPESAGNLYVVAELTTSSASM